MHSPEQLFGLKDRIFANAGKHIIQGASMTSNAEYIGIDVSKSHLDDGLLGDQKLSSVSATNLKGFKN